MIIMGAKISLFLSANMKATRRAPILYIPLFHLILAASICSATYRPNNVNRGNIQSQHSLSTDSRQEQKVRQTMSRDMLKYMNLSADPCADFYEYACGNWERYHTRQLREGELITAQNLIEASIVEQLQQLLTLPLSLPPHQHPNEQGAASASNIRKVRSFYDSCVAVEANADERRQFLMKILREHGGLRNIPNSHWKHDYHWVQMLAALRRNYGLNILIGLDVDMNLVQMNGNSIYLGEPSLTIIPPEHCNALITRQANVREYVYEQIQQNVADNLREWFAMESGEAARFGGDIVRFEFELCKGMREHEILPATQYGNQEFSQLSAYNGRSRTGQERLRQQQAEGSSLYPRTKLTDLTAKMGNVLDFKLFVENILENNYPDYVYLRSQSYLTHLVRTAKQNNHVTISGYILYRALLELNQPSEEHAMLRPRQCVRLMQRLFPQVLGDLYQRHVQRDDLQHDVEDVFRDLVKAFDQQLRVEWLDDSDRRTARSRLAQYHIQFPDYQGVDLSGLHYQKTDDYWKKLETTLRFNAREYLNTLRGNDFGQSPDIALNAFEVRATLAPRQQAVFVGWGLMQSPYYNHFYPKALRYALLGQRMASALLHAFDDEGWNRHPQVTAPWNEFTMSGYRNVTECQRVQYSNYISDQPSEFRNSTRLREIIAENAALNVAFNAYLGWLEQLDFKMKGLLFRETLRDLNFTNTQLFFIYFAQLRCWAKPNQEPPSEGMPLMQHTPLRWDTNGPLSNSEEFGREFGCALGTNMNTGNKCLVF